MIFKYFQVPKGENVTIRLLDQMPKISQYYIPPERSVKNILDPHTFFDRYEVSGDVETVIDRPTCVCQRCQERRAKGLPPHERYMLPVIDRETQKQLMLSVPATARRVLAELLEKLRQSEERAELIRLQQVAAKRFKESKMIYGAKR